jgi:hypothetical protein
MVGLGLELMEELSRRHLASNAVSPTVAPRRDQSDEAAVKLSSCVMCLLPEHPSPVTEALRVLIEVKKDLAEIQIDDIDAVDRAPLDELLADIQAQAARLAAAL